MKTRLFISLAAIPALLLAVAAEAHDPAEHMKNGESPDCAAMHDMDHSKMDMNDPVMQAMMQQCAEDAHQHEADSTEHGSQHDHLMDRDTTEK